VGTQVRERGEPEQFSGSFFKVRALQVPCPVVRDEGGVQASGRVG
jgi:hypothetical protein